MSKPRLRIAVLGTRGIPEVMGGVETHCQALYPRLVAKGHSVTLFARKGYVADGAPATYHGVEVIPLWTPRRKSLEAICHTAYGVLWIACHRRRFDLVHIHAIGPALLIPLAKLIGLRVVMTHHGADYDRKKWGPLAKWVLRQGEKVGCRFASAVITVSRHIKTCIKELYGTNGQFIPNGVPVPIRLHAGTTLMRYGLEPSRYILAMGRLVPEKGFHDLLSAFGGIETDWKLIIAGAADHEDDYSRGLLRQAQSDRRVVMAGFVKGKELAELLSCAALFVLPSYHEGLPIAVLEAMSYGLPLLTSDIPANKELAPAEVTFPVGDIAALRDKLTAFVACPWNGDAGRDLVSREYDWDVIADSTEKVYLSVMPQPRQRMLVCGRDVTASR